MAHEKIVEAGLTGIEPMTNPNSLPIETKTLLNDLRSRIRMYVLWEGLALVVVVLGTIFWLSFAFDWAYFHLSHLELPRWFRATVLITGIGLVAAGAFSWIALRLFRSFRTKALALILERRFPELDDRLITAVEASEGLVETHSPVTAAMLQRTLTDVAHTARQLDLGSVFNHRPLRRAAIVAVGLVASILGLMVVDSSAMERWVAGYLSLRDGYWPRETNLVLKVIVQPGDRVREFVDGRYRHPKGGDLSLVIEVPEGKTPPDRIRLDTRMGRGLTQIYLTPSTDHAFRHTIVGLIEDTRLWVSGGDYTHSAPYTVEVVPPPEVKQVILHSLYPAYTDLNLLENGQFVRTPNELKGSQISLPLQTDLLMEVVANKPLQRARLEGDAGADRWEIELGTSDAGLASAFIVLKSQEGRPQVRVPLPPLPAGMSTADSRMAFTIPFLLVADGATVLPSVVRAAAESGQPLTLPLPLPPDSLLRITLEDIDQIASPAPIRFAINGIVDQPPLVETKLKGIGTSITRKARIPIVGTITDDYGIASAQFDFRVDDASAWQPRLLAAPPEGEPREFTLQRSESEAFERFDVQPLDLSIKQRLTLTVAAIDDCAVPGPSPTGVPTTTAPHETAATPPTTAHRTQGLKYIFTIIPEEELLSMLYGRELGLRKRVEQIVVETKESLKDLQTQHDKLPEWSRLKSSNVSPDDDRLKAILQGLNAAADRSLHGIRKSAVENAGVELAFGEIREELINNAADTPAMLERLDVRILGPLNAINTKNFPGVDGALGLFKLALDKNTDPVGVLETSIAEMTTLIQNLERVLGEMQELARFDSVLEDLKKTIKAEMDLLEETKRKRKEKAIRALE